MSGDPLTAMAWERYRMELAWARRHPIIRSTTHAPDQTRGQPQLLQCELNLAAPAPVLFCI